MSIFIDYQQILAGVEGLEPPTIGFGDRCSTNSNYTPKIFLNSYSYTTLVSLSIVGKRQRHKGGTRIILKMAMVTS